MIFSVKAFSFAPSGLDLFSVLPTAYALGCNLSPLCGWLFAKLLTTSH
jgi:hypothetical protein